MQRIVKELSDKIGLGGALDLIRRWGGREVYVPTTVKTGDPLALTLGTNIATELVRHFGGTRLQLPAERNALLDLRNNAILDAHAAGESLQQIALRYGISRQHAGLIVSTIKARRAAKQYAGAARA